MTIYSLVQWLPLSWWWAQHQSKKKALTVSLLYPDFPFLVCPNFFLGCLAKTWELRQIFPRQAAFHFFSFSSSLARSDIILRLPPEVTSMLSQPNTSTASNALTPGPLITSKPSSEMSLRSLKMHLHLVALMPLSTNWTLSVFSTTSPPSWFTHATLRQVSSIPPLDLAVAPGDFLTMCSTLHSQWLSVQPGDGIFFLPISLALRFVPSPGQLQSSSRQHPFAVVRVSCTRSNKQYKLDLKNDRCRTWQMQVWRWFMTMKVALTCLRVLKSRPILLVELCCSEGLNYEWPPP